ncbi:SAM-dependent methyltransferase [Saccharopolyspora sp. K220]|uniref:SAM-dependent methyltransferase n=1 Tax=Saccharopolyspora soli TaxID=2926618 RepID=UPI001F59CCD4|nr:SAM-dependent methyltransferase [Saccharopolyspora soli]MCI2422992.1 SAM-dependent methyltransferase [Saccharopolyspora soli]
MWSRSAGRSSLEDPVGMGWVKKGSADRVQPEVDLHTDVPHSARIYDYLLGGRDNFAVDREAAGEITQDWQNLPKSMRANRSFMARVTRRLVRQGYRQFLDIGTGLPTSPNLHEAAQEVAPESRVLYVDNDPIVLVHARALLTSHPAGRTAYVDADLRDPEAILRAEEFVATVDLDQPVVLSLLAILQFIPDEQEALGVVQRLVDPLPKGSALALSTVTGESAPEEVAKGVAAYNAKGIPTKARSKPEVERFFTGLELVEPGVTLINHWHPDEAAAAVSDAHVHMYGGVAIKR